MSEETDQNHVTKRVGVRSHVAAHVVAGGVTQGSGVWVRSHVEAHVVAGGVTQESGVWVRSHVAAHVVAGGVWGPARFSPVFATR